MSEVTALLNALWPYALAVAVLIVLAMFRPQIQGLLPRLKHATLLGKNEVEFESELQVITKKEGIFASDMSRTLKQLPSPTTEAGSAEVEAVVNMSILCSHTPFVSCVRPLHTW